jgi:hypothetical protein
MGAVRERRAAEERKGRVPRATSAVPGVKELAAAIASADREQQSARKMAFVGGHNER